VLEGDVLNLKQLANGGLPEGILKPEANLTKEQAAMLREQWNQVT
jgi:hypothetical protein